MLYKQKSRLVVDEVVFTEPQPKEVVVKIAASGVCHTDLHLIERSMEPSNLPMVLGHEGSGVVEAVGEEVTLLEPGDHVVLTFSPSCGKCYFCTLGRPNLCVTPFHKGGSGRLRLDGTPRLWKGDQKIRQFFGLATFAEYTVVPEETAIRIPRDVPLDSACLLGCAVTTGVGAVINTAQVEPGSTVAVFGIGGVGLNVVQGANLAGADKVIAIDILDRKLEWARDFGATHIINAFREDVNSRIREITDGLGADYAFEAIGNVQVMAQALRSVRRGGKTVIIGSTERGKLLSISPGELLSDEKILMGSRNGSVRPRTDIPMLIRLYKNGRIKLDELITRRYPLEEVNTALEDLQKGVLARGVLIINRTLN